MATEVKGAVKVNWSLIWAILAFIVGNAVQIAWQASAKIESLQELSDHMSKIEEKVDNLNDKVDTSNLELARMGERQKNTNERLEKLEANKH